MQLTQFTDLGLRILMYVNQEGRPIFVTNAEIAEQFEVPLNHLVKVANKLTKLGWLAAIRGRNGGLTLNVNPSQLSIATVVRELEGTKPLIDCQASACTLTGRCQLARALNNALEAFYHSLETITLADVCARDTGQAILRMHRDFLSAQGMRLSI